LKKEKKQLRKAIWVEAFASFSLLLGETSNERDYARGIPPRREKGGMKRGMAGNSNARLLHQAENSG